MLDYRIETFLCVCDTMNYRTTADILHITQPAVSQHIKYLEKKYKCTLFTYQNRRLKKTKSAAVLEKYSRTMKMNEENLIRLLKNSEINELNIGATKTIGECVIGDYVENFIKKEDNKITLFVDNTEHLLTLIDDCRLDFALIEGGFDKSKYGYILFRKEPFVGICAKNHPFSEKEIDLQDLFSETMICREEGSGTRAILEETLISFNENIEHFKRNICISSFNMITDFVRKGYGISFVYEVLAKYAGLSEFRIKNCEIKKEFNFVYLKNTGAEEKIKYFIESGKKEV